jgi:ferrous iron transport protein A
MRTGTLASSTRSESAESLCTLDQLAPGQRATVVGMAGDEDLRRRLLEMGLVPGTPVELLRRAPLGDPSDYHVRGYPLS